MNILIASGGFKEGPSAAEVVSLIKQGIEKYSSEPNILTRPLCDGGTGLAHFFLSEVGGHEEEVLVSGPLIQRKVNAKYTITSDNLVVIDSASAAGLALLNKPDRNPLQTTTFGVGEVVKSAYNNGFRKFLIGCGDSATNDCGIGFANALGISFFDAFHAQIPPKGMYLKDVDSINISKDAKEIIDSCTFEVACNPSSVLCGSHGTSKVYGPQKGANASAVEVLHTGVERFVSKLEEKSNKEIEYCPGAGGAGGLAAMIYTIFNGKLTFSFDVVRRLTKLDQLFRKSDLVITSEGFLDSRTLHGKLPGSIALYAKRFNLPVAAIVGGLSDDIELLYYSGFDAVEVATKLPCEVQFAIDKSETWIPDASSRLVRKLFLGSKISKI